MPTEPSFQATRTLLRRAQDGHTPALDELLGRYRDRLLGRVRLMMGPEARRLAESSDFLQGVMVEIMQGLDHFEPRDEQAFLRWAAQIARNNIRDEVRRKRERALESFSQSVAGGRPDTEDATPSREAALGEEVERLVEGLEQLSPDHQLVIELRDFENLPYREIAERMDRPSEEAVQMLRARALAKLSGIVAD